MALNSNFEVSSSIRRDRARDRSRDSIIAISIASFEFMIKFGLKFDSNSEFESDRELVTAGRRP